MQGITHQWLRGLANGAGDTKFEIVKDMGVFSEGLKGWKKELLEGL